MRRLFVQTLVVALVAGLGLELTARVLEPRRAKLEILGEARVSGEAYPASTAQQVLLLTDHKGFGERGLLPLGGISGQTTVFCQEEDDWLLYRADRYGFNNPDSVWEQPQADVAIVGDSFAQGACVPPGSAAADLLRRGRDGTPRTVLNLGSYGNGPLSNLAGIKEYLAAKKPKTVFWYYVPNDLLMDLAMERESAVLRKYLVQRRFTQGLIHRQAEVDHELKTQLSSEEALERQQLSQTGLGWTMQAPGMIQRFLQRKLRGPPLVRAFVTDYDDSPSKLNLPLLQSILKEARETVHTWGGRLVFVFVPDAQMFAPGDHERTAENIEALHRSVLAVATAESDAVMDLYAELKREDQPLWLYAALGAYYGHFNREGYRRLAMRLEGAIASKPLLSKASITPTRPAADPIR